MTFQVTFSERSERNLDAILQYLAENWSETVKPDFLAQLSDKLQHLSQMPYMYRASAQKPGVRECLVNKYTLLYYRIQGEEVEIITIQDTRQDPGKLNL